MNAPYQCINEPKLSNGNDESLSFLATITLGDIVRCAVPFFLVTIAGSRHYVELGQQSSIEAVGYAWLIMTVLYSSIHGNTCNRRDLFFALIVLVLLIPGFIFEKLILYRKLSFILSAVVLICSSILSKGLLFKRSDIQLAVYGITSGVVVSFFFAIADGLNMGVIGNFDGGILYKNYFAGNILCIFIGLTCSVVCGGKWTFASLCVASISLVMIIVSGSKGAFLLTASFIISILHGDFYYRNNQRERILIGISILMLFVPLSFFLQDWLSDIETYQYRIRGLQNYLDYVNGDIKHLLIGNSELLYNGQNGYALYFRELTGWNGSIELAWLNILMKHGLLGIIAYISISLRLFYFINQCHGKSRSLSSAIFITLLLSSFVESYLETMHSIVGPFCFILINSIVFTANYADGNQFTE